MDPTEVLLAADCAIDEGDQDWADERLEDYVYWRGSGGYEPKLRRHTGMADGDAFHRMLIARYVRRFGEYLGAVLP